MPTEFFWARDVDSYYSGLFTNKSMHMFIMFHLLIWLMMTVCWCRRALFPFLVWWPSCDVSWGRSLLSEVLVDWEYQMQLKLHSSSVFSFLISWTDLLQNGLNTTQNTCIVLLCPVNLPFDSSLPIPNTLFHNRIKKQIQWQFLYLAFTIFTALR